MHFSNNNCYHCKKNEKKINRILKPINQGLFLAFSEFFCLAANAVMIYTVFYSIANRTYYLILIGYSINGRTCVRNLDLRVQSVQRSGSQNPRVPICGKILKIRRCKR